MHQWADFEENKPARTSMLPFDGESETEFIAALQADLEQYDTLRRQELGEGFCALAYPLGYYNDLIEVLVHEAGIPVTISIRTDSRNVLVRGLPQSLYTLCRMNVTNRTTGEDLPAYLA